MNQQEIPRSADAVAHKPSLATFWKAGGDVADLAVAQILCFLTLTRLEPRFFIIHLYQLIPYVAILILIGYGRARWAYMIGPVVSIVWLGLAYSAGLLGSAVERLRTFGNKSLDANLVAFVAVVTALLAVLMTVLSGVHWVKEFSGRGLALRTLLISIGIVMVYYAVLLRWFWEMIPDA